MARGGRTDEHAPRERLVYSAAQLLRAQGMSGTGVRDVIDHSATPRGSFQHYFPGGKDQLVGEALLWSGNFAAERIEHYVATARRPTPGGLFARMADQWKRDLANDFERGCPVVATAADIAGSDSPVTGPLTAATDRWERAIADALVTMGVPRPRAKSLATLMLSALEGAIVLARIRRDVGPLSTVVSELRPLLGG
jgi:AcrR family transcriptional regulator